jgi:hypothetical protein
MVEAVVHFRLLPTFMLDIYTVFKHLSMRYTDISLYRGIFTIVKITITTHNAIVCISFDSKSAHSSPPIFLHVQKEDSLSFQTVLDAWGPRQHLLNSLTA